MSDCLNHLMKGKPGEIDATLEHVLTVYMVKRTSAAFEKLLADNADNGCMHCSCGLEDDFLCCAGCGIAPLCLAHFRLMVCFGILETVSHWTLEILP